MDTTCFTMTMRSQTRTRLGVFSRLKQAYDATPSHPIHTLCENYILITGWLCDVIIFYNQLVSCYEYVVSLVNPVRGAPSMAISIIGLPTKNLYDYSVVSNKTGFIVLMGLDWCLLGGFFIYAIFSDYIIVKNSGADAGIE